MGFRPTARVLAYIDAVARTTAAVASANAVGVVSAWGPAFEGIHVNFGANICRVAGIAAVSAIVQGVYWGARILAAGFVLARA